MTAATITVAQAMEQAVKHHKAGDLRLAEAIYRQILSQQPNHHEAINLLGVIAHQVGNYDAAASLVVRAIEIAPGHPDYYNNAGMAYAGLKRWSDAILCYRRGMEFSSEYADLHNNLGNALMQSSGSVEEAITSYRKTIELRPDHAEAHNNLGNALRQTGDIEDAIRMYRQAVALRPDYAEAYHNLGDLLMEAGRTTESVEAYQQALRYQVNFVEAWNNLGNALRMLRQFEQSQSAFARALEFQPNRSEIWSNLGTTFRAWGRRDDAIMAFRKSIDLKPDFAEGFNNLGAALQEAGELEKAVEYLRKAVELRPNYAEALNNLGGIHDEQRRLDEAVDHYRRAVAANPAFSPAHNNIANYYKNTGRIDDALASFSRAMEIRPDDPEVGANYIYALHCHPQTTPQTLLREQERWEKAHAEHAAKHVPIYDNDRDPERRIRVGFVSGDFSDHVVAHNLLPIFEHRDAAKLEVYGYDNGLKSDAVTTRVRAQADQWRHITPLDDDSPAQLIRDDRIDILIDLSLHSGRNRLLVFARRPAPVQICYLGYCGSTGLRCMDYRISDPYLDDAETESHYREKTLYLPHCYWCYRPSGEAPDVRELPSERNGFVTFGCLNNFSKVSEPVQKLWAEILKEVEDSRLVLYCEPGRHRDELHERFANWGINRQRVSFVPRQIWLKYMESLGHLDVALDPFPYNGGITSCDVLWMGVPLVTLVGKTSVGRAGKSILSNLGFPELIAQSPEQYASIAMNLARDPARRRELRDALRPKMSASPLMDAARFTADFQDLLRGAWRRWCAGD